MKAIMPAMRMRTLLLLPLLLIPVALTTSSLLIVRRNMQQELQQGLAEDLLHSSATFRNLERGRRGMLVRSAILLADQPSLKALMTTQDARTIQNAGGRYASLTGSDLFALTSPTGDLIAFYEGSEQKMPAGPDPAISAALRNPASSPYIDVHGKLYEIAAQPIYFGSSESGSVLGYLVVGAAIDHSLAQQVAQSVSGEVAFSSNHRIVSSSLSQQEDIALGKMLTGGSADNHLSTVTIAGEPYRLDRIQLSGESAVPVEMILLKSMRALRTEETSLNRRMIIIGLIAFAIGGLLALGVARLLTAPLEELAVGVRALGEGEFDTRLPRSGATEVRDLSRAVDAMRKQIRKAQDDLLEAERLATIGTMASSVSHDVRHYLSSVYANAEFLASQDLGLDDKMELLKDIRLSVQGTTDLIDSLLLFSRTGLALNKSYESVAYLAERAIALLKNHPEASGVEVSFKAEGSCETLVDVKKIERVIYNLALNACQAAQKSDRVRTVEVNAAETGDSVVVDVIDSGAGVASEIRDSLFDPFISANKENGVGIGLTLASTIASEHGGWVRLEETSPGRTVFRLMLPRTHAGQVLQDAAKS
jgi:signal transduction histidine kinase